MNDAPATLTIATYAALMLAAAGLWIGPPVWIASLLLATICGYASGVLFGPAIIWFIVFAGLCLLYARLKNRPASKIVVALGLLSVALLLGLHALPGFHNYLVAKDVVLSPGAAPYTLYLNFDKAAVGILLIGLLIPSRIRNWHEAVVALRQAAPLALLMITILICASIALGYLNFDPKWHRLFWIWAASNLFLTCISEEAVFRGFIQRELTNWLRPAWSAVAVSAILFGLAHAAGGWMYVLLSTVAGLGYGLVYRRTGRLEMAILTHFSLNAIHFLFFTYPRVA